MAIVGHGSMAFETSPSPQPQPLTKRDVRRNRIMEKLQGMIDSFSSNQHNHYRAQLQGVQVDMTLVLRADPYNDGPLADAHDDIREAVESVIRGDSNGNGGLSLPQDDAARSDFWSIAGKRYGEFVREVNDAIEQRDADLTALHNNYDAALAELERIHQQRLHQAEEEHKNLTATIRQRLVATLTKKRQQLLRDKEHIDISDSNAMLLHPNHFSIGNNPASPSQNGNITTKRTRHLRHHRGASPAPAGAETIENGKRKRKLAQMEDEQGGDSPLPHLTGGRSPFKDARIQREYAQFDVPAYSLERIFTEKELVMATNTAQEATFQYFHQPRQQEGSNGNGTAVPSVDGEVIESAEAVPDEQALYTDATAAAAGNTPPPSEPLAAVGMERTASHQVLTRGGARANPLAALADAATSDSLVKRNPFTPTVPRYHAITRAEKSGAPAPLPVDNVDLENDFNMMRQAGMDNEEEYGHLDPSAGEDARGLRRQLLDQALGVSGVQAPYRLPPLEPGPGAMIDRRGVERELRTGFAPLPQVVTHIESRGRGVGGGGSLAAALSGRLGGGEPMSRTTSAGGMSERGGIGRGRGY